MKKFNSDSLPGFVPLGFALIVLIVCIQSSCSHPAVKFIPKLDSVQVVYKDSLQGPFIFTALYQTTRTFLPLDSQSTTGHWLLDTIYALKIQTDTNKLPNAVHTYKYQQVNKRYIQIIAPK